MRTLSGIISRSFSREINILTAPTHERYQSGFSDIDATFHMIQLDGFKPWNSTYGEIPKNHVLWPKNYIPSIRFDAILSQNRFGQLQHFKHLSSQLGCPLISLEHTLPAPFWTESQADQLKALKGHLNVFISEYSKREWGYENVKSAMVVNHCVDTNLFSPSTEKRENKILCVVNDFKNRDVFCGYSIYEKIKSIVGEENFTLVGDNPGLSEPAKSVEELASIYGKHKIFLNTSLVSPIPTALLEAMSCGCAVVSTDTCMIPEILDGTNGIRSNDVDDLCNILSRLLTDDALCATMGAAARQTITRDFSKQTFTDNWSRIISEVVK